VNKLRISLFFIYLCAASSFLFGQSYRDIVEDGIEEISGRGLEIRSNPPGVKVFIDGVERGLTPFSIDTLTAGEYQIRLSRDDYEDKHFTAVLFNNSRLVISAKMEIETGTVELVFPFKPADLRINNGGAEVTLLEMPDSDTISASFKSRTGRRTVTVSGFGLETESLTVQVIANETVKLQIQMKDAEFKIGRLSQSRKRFNPKSSLNSGLNEYHFDVSAAGTGVFQITNKDGDIVYSRELDNFTQARQRVTWDGRDENKEIVPQGRYTVSVAANEYAESIETEIIYSNNIFPLSLSGGSPGLVFSALPHVLPKGSFQIEGGLLLGNFPNPQVSERPKPFSTVPFDIGFRLSPLSKFEVSSIFNANPQIGSGTGWGITGSLKYNIADGSGASPLAFAAGFSYAWASENGESPLSPGRGVGIYLPLSFELSNFSLALSPAVFWHGPEGAVPLLLISAGILYRGDTFNAGLSFRPEIDFKNTEKNKYLTGAEVKIYPPPSNLVFSFSAGVWTQNSVTGGYGGLGIGFIY
jgi:hypothetical protein